MFLQNRGLSTLAAAAAREKTRGEKENKGEDGGPGGRKEETCFHVLQERELGQEA